MVKNLAQAYIFNRSVVLVFEHMFCVLNDEFDEMEIGFNAVANFAKMVAEVWYNRPMMIW